MTAPVPSYEVGYVRSDGGTNILGWQQWMDDERVPELRWPYSVGVFGRMRREDGRVSSVESAIGLPIRRTPWRVEPNGASDEVTEFVARNLGLPVQNESSEDKPRPRTRGRFSWAEHLRVALLMLPYGHSYFEQVYYYDEGRFYLKKLAPRPSRTIEGIDVARDGGLKAIVQRIPSLDYTAQDVINGGIRIPVDRLVAYVRDPEPGNWVGTSLLRPAYKHWLLKDELMRIEAAVARRNGMGVPVATAPEGSEQGVVDKYRDMATEYRGGEKSGVGLPAGADFKLLGVQGNLPDMRQAIEYHDRQIALAGLAHFLNLDRGGSYALASVQADTFVQSVQAFGETVRDIANAHIVEDLVDINFGRDVPAPQIVFDEIGSRQDLTANALKMLIDAGLIRLDRDLEEYTRQQYGLPPKGTPPPGQQPPSGGSNDGQEPSSEEDA
jgi:hypothetical protein